MEAPRVSPGLPNQFPRLATSETKPAGALVRLQPAGLAIRKNRLRTVVLDFFLMLCHYPVIAVTRQRQNLGDEVTQSHGPDQDQVAGLPNVPKRQTLQFLLIEDVPRSRA